MFSFQKRSCTENDDSFSILSFYRWVNRGPRGHPVRHQQNWWWKLGLLTLRPGQLYPPDTQPAARRLSPMFSTTYYTLPPWPGRGDPSIISERRQHLSTSPVFIIEGTHFPEHKKTLQMGQCTEAYLRSSFSGTGFQWS